MALIDGIKFTPSMLDNQGNLRYTRTKSGVRAVVKLPDYVATLVKNVELDSNTTHEQPFRRNDVEIQSTEQHWRLKLQQVFDDAGIKSVETEAGMKSKKAHPHMLRDTCAVWYLRHGATFDEVAKMLGHASSQMTQRYYAPFVPELEQARLSRNQQILEAASLA